MAAFAAIRHCERRDLYRSAEAKDRTILHEARARAGSLANFARSAAYQQHNAQVACILIGSVSDSTSNLGGRPVRFVCGRRARCC